MLIEEYAPRSAVYEALPGFLLRLNAGEFSEKGVARKGSPVWVRVSGGRGSYESKSAVVGAEYGFDRISAEVGMDVLLDENITGSISVRSIRGSAAVNSSVGGGNIVAEGIGIALGASLRDTDANYVRGRLSLTNFSMDLTSSERGRLKRGVDATGYSLDLEAGRQIKLLGKTKLTPRVWLTGSQIDMDAFTDAVNARVSVDDASRLAGGLGVVGELADVWNLADGALSLRSSVDLEHTLVGAETAVEVSGTRLESEARRTRVQLGVGGRYRRGGFSIGGEVSAGGLASGDESYSGRIAFGLNF